MRKILFLLTLALGALVGLHLGVASEHGDAPFEEGTHYMRLENPVSTSVADGKVEVVELFWYGCPHCYSLEPHVEEWVATLPEHVEYLRVPAVLNRNWELGARAFYIAQALGMVEEIHRPLFDAIHQERRPMRTREDLAAFFTEHGVSAKDFDDAYGSFQVETNLRRSQEQVRRYRARGVPAFVVNGKYLTATSMAGSEERVFEVVDFLVSREAREG